MKTIENISTLYVQDSMFINEYSNNCKSDIANLYNYYNYYVPTTQG